MVKRGAAGILLATAVALAALACGDDDGGLPDFLVDGTATATATASATSSAEPTDAAPSPTAGGPTEYTIQPGDTLVEIAARFGTTALAIAELNGIADPAVIFPGDVIRIPE